MCTLCSHAAVHAHLSLAVRTGVDHVLTPLHTERYQTAWPTPYDTKDSHEEPRHSPRLERRRRHDVSTTGRTGHPHGAFPHWLAGHHCYRLGYHRHTLGWWIARRGAWGRGVARLLARGRGVASLWCRIPLGRGRVLTLRGWRICWLWHHNILFNLKTRISSIVDDENESMEQV